LFFSAKVRNGFVPRTRREVASRFTGLETDVCPFANLPEKKRTQWALTKEEMKNCLWLKPKLVAQIEFAEWTPDGRPDLSLRSLRGNLPRTHPTALPRYNWGNRWRPSAAHKPCCRIQPGQASGSSSL